MPLKPPPLPDADDLPEMDDDDTLDNVLAAEMAVDKPDSERLTAETEDANSLEDMSVQSLEDAPALDPLDFHDGTEMGRYDQ